MLGTVDAELTATLTPTAPAACIAAVASVAVSCQVAGSALAAGQSLAATVVGFVPVTDRRSFSGDPAT